MFGDARGFFYEAWNARRASAAHGLPTRLSCRATCRRSRARRAARPALPVAESAGQAGERARRRGVRRRGRHPPRLADLRPLDRRWCSAPTTSATSGSRKASRTASSVLSERAVFSYLCTAPYDQAADAGIRWNDAQLAIDWPVGASVAVGQGCERAVPRRRRRRSACRSTCRRRMKLLLLGGDGQLGTRLRRSARAAGRSGRRPRAAARSPTARRASRSISTDLDAIAAAGRARRAGHRRQRRRAHRGRPRRGRTRARPPHQRARRRRASRPPAPQRDAHAGALLDRLRLRRPRHAAVSRGRRDRAARRLRRAASVPANRRSQRSGARHADLPHRVGVRRRTATTSCARCCAWAPNATNCASSPTRSARRRPAALLADDDRAGPAPRRSAAAACGTSPRPGKTSWHGFATAIFDGAVCARGLLREATARRCRFRRSDYPTPASAPRVLRCSTPYGAIQRDFGDRACPIWQRGSLDAQRSQPDASPVTSRRASTASTAA